jgi:hypothetical protein
MFKYRFTDEDVLKICDAITDKVMNSILSVNVDVLTDALQQCSALDQKLILESSAVMAVVEKTDRLSSAARYLNEKLDRLDEVLELHLQVATVRAGLETSNQGVYDSLVLGLKHMRKQCDSSYYSGQTRREYEAVAKKIDTLLREFEALSSRAQIDDLIHNIKAITSVPTSKRERKRVDPG